MRRGATRAQIFDAPVKDDQATMKHPMFGWARQTGNCARRYARMTRKTIRTEKCEAVRLQLVSLKRDRRTILTHVADRRAKA
jgi:hypothetical protein